MKASILVFPGSNREGDVAQAIELVTGRRPNMVWHGDGDFEKTDLIVVPGGFSTLAAPGPSTSRAAACVTRSGMPSSRPADTTSASSKWRSPSSSCSSTARRKMRSNSAWSKRRSSDTMAVYSGRGWPKK